MAMKLSRFLFLLILFCPAGHLRSQSGPPVTTIEIRFSGNERVPNSELVENFKSCSGGQWKEFTQRSYEYFAQKCSRPLMYSKGFWRANVADVTHRLHHATLAVQVKVIEGPRYRLGKVKIEGNEILSEKEILEVLGQRAGDIADGRAIQDFVYERLKQRYDALGYVQYNAEFEPSFTDPRDWKLDGVVDVLLTIDEGRRFKVRRIRFAGVDDKESELLVGEFLFKSGEIFSGRKLQDAVDKFNELGRFEIIDKDQDVEIRTDEEGGDVDLVITLRKPNS